MRSYQDVLSATDIRLQDLDPPPDEIVALAAPEIASEVMALRSSFTTFAFATTTGSAMSLCFCCCVITRPL